MAHIGNPAYNATLGTGAGMMVLAAAGVGLVNALGDGIAAAHEARNQARYDVALTTAINHAGRMETVARVAMEQLAKVEAENKALRASCRQRQDVIDLLKKRIR